jgi:1-deoxy-D-xylulose 5-phosphate reductoisomerase
MTRAIDLGRRAWKAGPQGLISLCASDEVAVELFLAKKLPFHLIPELIAKTLTSSLTFDISTPKACTNGFRQAKQTAMEIGKRLCLSY